MSRRMFVWTPGNVAHVREQVFCFSPPSVVLVPLEVGTALVCTEPTRPLDGVKVAEGVRDKDVQPVLFMWDDEATAVYPGLLGWDWGSREAVLDLTMRPRRFGPLGAALVDLLDRIRVPKASHAKYVRVARRLATALSADEDAIVGVVSEWQRGGFDVLVELLERAGKPDLVTMARLVESGVFDEWRGVPGMPAIPFAELREDRVCAPTPA